jgi:hypothetical protein
MDAMSSEPLSASPTPIAAPPKTYNDQLKQDFGVMIDGLSLKREQKEYLRMRWLDQILWMEGRATKARDRHYQMRVTAILGGVMVPILVGLTPVEGDRQTLQFFRYSTAALGAVVAMASAIEQFFNYGERWRSYRRSAEVLKSQGWQFFQLSGPYSKLSHESAFPVFAGQVEEVIQRDVEIYATQVTQEKKKEKDLDGDGKPDK